MKFSGYAVLALSALLLSSCSKLKVKSETLSDYDFSNVKTYEWVQAPDEIINEDDTYISENVQIALNNELSGRGWKQVLETEQADIQIVYYVKLAEHEEYAGPANSGEESQLTGGFTYNNSKGSWGYNEGQSDLNVYTIEVGTLTLLIYDAQTGEKLWNGTLETRIEREMPIEKHKEELARVARKIISRIP